jgi:glycosyltransferase involved in cell wall biosynthesis
MKVLMIIDHFGPGGAQRQIVELACGMKRNGHEVEMFIYFPQHDFFRPLLREQGIAVHEYPKGRGFSFGVLARLISHLRSRRFDAAVSYLSTSNIYAELAMPFSGGTRLVVSERTSRHDDKSALSAFLRRAMHSLADKVVANSRTHSDWLKSKWWLKNKAVCIYNGLNLEDFRPEYAAIELRGELHLVGIGRVGPEKNILKLIAALSILQADFGVTPQVSWAGSRDDSEAGRRYCRQIDDALDALPEIRKRWHWLGVQADVPGLLRRHDALIHPSLYEGLPNAVCEALATGVPVLASDVCDHPLLVAEGERGFLFDPESGHSIAAAIAKFSALREDERRRFSLNARAFAVANLSVGKMVSAYERLLEQVLGAAHARPPTGAP